MKLKRIPGVALTMALTLTASVTIAQNNTYTYANLSDDHFLWEYYPPSAPNDALVRDQKGCFYMYWEGNLQPVQDINDMQMCVDSNGDFGDYGPPQPRF